MFGFSIRTRQNGTDTPKSVASPVTFGSPLSGGGEIDTSAPFQSVKAAVSLFGEASPRNKPVHKRSHSSLDERVLEKETQHHLTLKELEGLKEQIRCIESSKAQALRDLDVANRTLEKLTNKLDTLSESKQAAIVAAEEAKKRLLELEEQKLSKAQLGEDAWKLDVDSERNLYKASAAELSSAKQELANLRQDFDGALEAKLAAFQEAADAQHKTQESRGRADGLSDELGKMNETLRQIKLASQQAQDEHEKIVSEKEVRIQNSKATKEEIEDKIRAIREELESGLNQNFEEMLEETNERITVLQEQLNNMRASDMELFSSISSELQSAKEELQEIVPEENSLRSIVDSIKQELESLKEEHAELERAASEVEAANERLQADLENSKKELEAINAGEIQAADASNDTYSIIQKLLSEAEAARKEAEELKRDAEVLNQEAEAAKLATKEKEEQLQAAMVEAEDAKASQKVANEEIQNSSRTDSDGAANDLETKGKNIKLTVEQFDALSKKVEQTRVDADIKIATTKAQVETIRASEEETLKKLEASQKENEDLKEAIEDASKQAEMAEAAKQIVEGELQKWHEIE